MKKSVFISYSCADEKTVRDIVDFLEGKGMDCFMAPRDIKAGASYAARLTNAIKECKAAVLVASRAINSSEHILNELDIIVTEKKFFVPFFIENFELDSEYRYYLGRKQRIMAYSGKPSDHFSKLIDALKPEIEKKNTAQGQTSELVPAMANNTRKIFSYIPHRGIMINPEDQQRNVSFRTDTFIGIFGDIYDEIVALSNKENASNVLNVSGYSCGRAFAQRLNSQWDLSTQGASLYEEKLRKWCQFDSDVGWGKFDIDVTVNEETGDFRGALTINECFIVDLKKKRHVCAFVKGYCEGVIETLLGIEVTLSCRVCPLKSRFKTTCVFDIFVKEE